MGAARAFVALVFGGTVLLNLPLLLARTGTLVGPAERFMPLTVVSFFAPALAAFALAAREPGGVRALIRPFGRWRVGVAWLAVALLGPGALLIGAEAFYALLTGVRAGPWLTPPTDAAKALAMLIIPFTEQVAWRGYLYPRARRRWSPLAASVAVGFTWAIFHAMKHALMGIGMAPALTVVLVVHMTAGTVVYTWLCARAKGSMLVAVLANAGAYLNNSSEALPRVVAPFMLHTAAYVVVAALLVALDGRVFRGPRATG